MENNRTVRSDALSDAEVAALYENLSSTEKRSTKKRKKKNGSVRSSFLRPIVCPPDGAGRGRGIRISGYIARVIVLIFAVFGFSFFVADAFIFHYTAEVVGSRGAITLVDAAVTGTIFLASLVIVTVLSLVCLFRYTRIAAIGTLILAVGIGFIAVDGFLSKCIAIPATLWNCFLDRLHRVDYFTLIPQIENANAGLSEEFRVKAAAVLLVFIVAVLFVPFLIRRTRILPPLIFSAAILVFIFSCNISRSNWAFATMLASFAAVIVMASYDKLYQRRAKAGMEDATSELFRDIDRPEVPKEVTERNARRAAEKAARAETKNREREKRRAQRREKQVVTVDKELSDYYFSDAKRQKKKASSVSAMRMTPTEKKAAKALKHKEKRDRRAEALAHEKELRADMEQVRAYDRVTVDSRAAAGGFAGLAAFLLLMLVLVFPAASVDAKFPTIEAIDERLASYREYLTALLVGDEDLLDKVDYEKNSSDTRSTALADRYYDGTALMYVQSHAAQNLYLKGWIAVDYNNGEWHSADDGQFDAYHALYGYDDYPAEELTTDFYRYMLSDYVADPLDESIDWSKKLSHVSDYGVILERINVNRFGGTELLGSLLYLPSTHVSEAGLFEYADSLSAELQYINYYDGILTGRAFREETEYSVLSYVTMMNDANFMTRLSKRIASYHLSRELYALYKTGYFTNPEVNPELSVVTEITNGDCTYIAGCEELSCAVSLTYNAMGVLYQAEVFFNEDASGINADLFLDYLTVMTKAERQELEESFAAYEEYNTFVYDTYLNTDIFVNEDGTTSSSALLSSLSDDIAADRTLTSDDLTNEATYNERHKYILSVIEYMRENCVYLEHDKETYDIVIDWDAVNIDESLDAIENFLTVTKQGYCVQFASSLCLLLREQGIPARYVEGYVADDQVRNYSSREYLYDTTVRDYNLHAWVEVWYEGLGWVTYEATPGEYYNDMYPVENDDTVVVEPDNSVLPDRPEDDEEDPDTDSDKAPDDKDPMGDDDQAALEKALRRQALIRMSLWICAGVLLLLLLIAAVILIVKLAKKAETRRDKMIADIKAGKYGKDGRRAAALKLIDSMNELLALYGLTPLPGELREPYADRLFSTMPTVFGVMPEIQGDNSVAPAVFSYEMDARTLFLSIAAEEFGNGMTDAEMRELAEFYSRLRTVKKRFISPVRRFFLHYFLHKI